MGIHWYFFILVSFTTHNESFASFATLAAVKKMWWFWVEGAVDITVARGKPFSEATMKAINSY